MRLDLHVAVHIPVNMTNNNISHDMYINIIPNSVITKILDPVIGCDILLD